MNPQESLNVLNNAVAQMNASREVHEQLQQAVANLQIVLDLKESNAKEYK